VPEGGVLAPRFLMPETATLTLALVSADGLGIAAETSALPVLAFGSAAALDISVVFGGLANALGVGGVLHALDVRRHAFCGVATALDFSSGAHVPNFCGTRSALNSQLENKSASMLRDL